ncbi:hypothetical protein [Methylocella sp.]|uniref:hypothetical protein n=1 Tax=Methylocella sp. TaxID=1978226 RepID=UPI0035B0BABE
MPNVTVPAAATGLPDIDTIRDLASDTDDLVVCLEVIEMIFTGHMPELKRRGCHITRSLSVLKIARIAASKIANRADRAHLAMLEATDHG